MQERSTTSYYLEIEGLPIRVTRKRVKNVNFRVCANGEARMSVPWRMPRLQVEQMARDRLDWFREHLRRVEQRHDCVPHEWASHERLRVWGEERTLRVEEGSGTPSCRLEGNELVLCVPMGSTAHGRALFVERWFADELRMRLAVLLPVCEERIGVSAKSVTLRRMKTRWGSCTSSKGTIRLNTALAECPPECLEMVLVHELCHLLEPNHGSRFHALMDLHYPSWRVWQRWLNEHPPRT